MDIKSILAMVIDKLALGVAAWLVGQGLIDGSMTTAAAGAVVVIINIAWAAWMKWGMVLISKKVAMVKGIPLPGEFPAAKMTFGGKAVEVKSSIAF